MTDELKALTVEIAALRTRCATLEAVVESFPDAVFVKDLRGCYVMLNASGARLIGKSVDEVIGVDDSRLFVSESARRIAEVDQAIITERSSRTFEEVATTAAGTRCYLTTKVPYLDEQGRLVGIIGIARDVTENRRLQTDRDRLLDRVRLQIDRLPLAYILMDADRRVIERNPAAQSVFGYTKDEVLGRDCVDLIAPLPLNDALQETLRRVWAGDMNAHSIKENITQDNNMIIYNWYNAPLLDEDGRFVGLISLAQEITERKRAEESLARDAQLLASVRDSLQVTDLEGIVTYWNEGSTRLFGWHAQEMLGRHMTDRVPETGRAAMLAEIQAIVEGKDFSGEWEDYRKDGSRIWIDARVTRITDANGSPIGLIGVAHDISDRKQAEDALRQSEERFRRYFELGLIGMAITSPTKGILEVNDEICRILGYTREELLRKTWSEMTHPDDLATDIARFQRVMAGEIDGYTLDKRWVRKDGKVIDTTISVKCQRDQDRSVKYFVALLQDVTERQQAEQKIRELNADLERRVAERTAELTKSAEMLREQSDELARVNGELMRAARLKDEFLPNMSHELRTPLTGIMGFSESLMEGVYGPLNDGQRKSLSDVQECGRHLLSLINDILDVAKIEAGMVKLEPGVVDVRSICRAAINFIKDISHKKSISVQVQIDESVKYVIADERRLKQILVNLLSNAVKFTDPRGRVGLEVDVEMASQRVRITIWDTGIGIAPEGLKSLFKPFVQLDAELARQRGGTGLGLVLVKSLAELHGGSLHTESEVGKGSRFTVFLPWSSDDGGLNSEPVAATSNLAANLAVTEIAKSSPGRSKIFIVDDDVVSVRAIKEFLEFKGYAVEVITDAASGITRAQSLIPALILMDIQMPGMDGLEAIRQIRQFPGMSEIPIVALTAMAMKGDRERILRAGASEYISKPVSLIALHERIRGILATDPL